MTRGLVEARLTNPYCNVEVQIQLVEDALMYGQEANYQPHEVDRHVAALIGTRMFTLDGINNPHLSDYEHQVFEQSVGLVGRVDQLLFGSERQGIPLTQTDDWPALQRFIDEKLQEPPTYDTRFTRALYESHVPWLTKAGRAHALPLRVAMAASAVGDLFEGKRQTILAQYRAETE